MSRSGYNVDVDCYDTADMLRMEGYRQAIENALNGKRGQAFLRDLIAALDALEVKELHVGFLSDDSGHVCALGAVGVARGLDMGPLQGEIDGGEDDDEYSEGWDSKALGSAFGIAPSMAREIMFINDDQWGGAITPDKRWQLVRDWATRRLKT